MLLLGGGTATVAFVVGMLVASAVITPSGDPFTMVLVAIPLWVLYEICVIIARIWYKNDEKAEAEFAKTDESESSTPAKNDQPDKSDQP